MVPPITFTFEGKEYQVSSEAYDLHCIVLPDGRVLNVGEWRDSYPPQPVELAVDDMFQGFDVFPSDMIAELAGGVVAIEIS